MKIRRVELREIGLKLKEPFRISSGVVQQRRILLVKVVDEAGLSAWGECVAGESPNYSPETLDTCWLAIREWIAPRLLNQDIGHPSQVQPLLEIDFRGHYMAKAAVEMALWALEAERLNLSLSELLGGTRSSIAVGISLGIQPDPGQLVRKVEAAFQEGYRKVKIKIQPGQDLDYLAAVCERFGGERIMADANNAYSLEDIDLFERLDDLNLMMIEQPLAWDDLLRHATLQALVATPICLDESITSLDRARDMVQLKAGEIINIKPGRVGGFSSSLAIHDFCRQNSIPVWCGGMLESGIGRAHNVALASLPNFSLPGDVSPSRRYWERDIVDPEWKMDSDGSVTVPREKAGLGVAVDEDFIRHLTVRSEILE